MIWLILSLVMSVSLNAALIFAVSNMIRRVESYEDFYQNLQEGLSHVLSQVRSIDIRGAFEADDEVGLVFKAIHGMIESLKVFLENMDAEKKEN